MKAIARLFATAVLLVAACSSSKDTTGSGGKGGTASAGRGGGGAGRGGSAGGGSGANSGAGGGGAGASGAGGGTAGAGGAGAEGGGAGTAGAGAAGTTGAAGQAGSGAAVGSAGAGGRGGAAGTTGAAGGGGAAGTGGQSCPQSNCLRPYVCVRACGSAPEYTGCCPCEAPLFDDYNGRACGDGGQGDGGPDSISYVGCTFIGGIDHVVIGKRDTTRNLCFNLDLKSPARDASAGLTLPPNYGVEGAVAGAASACPSRFPQGTAATAVTGTVSLSGTGTGWPTSANVDLTMTFGANDAGVPTTEILSAQHVDITPSCP